MPLFRTFRQDGLLVGVWKMDETAEELLSRFDREEPYREAVGKYVSEARKREWLAVRVLLKTLCGKEEEIGYIPSGKPYLKRGGGYVSISHTRGYVAVALHPVCEVGIDIEQYGDRVKRVVSRFVRPDEMESVSRGGDEVYALLLHWSAKESLFKVMGVEGVDFVRHLHILPFVPAEEGCFEAREYRTAQQRHYRVCYLTHPDFVLTWVVQRNNAQANHFG